MVRFGKGLACCWYTAAALKATVERWGRESRHAPGALRRQDATDRHRNTHTHSHAHTDTHTQTHTQTHTHTDTHTDTHTHRHRDENRDTVS